MKFEIGEAASKFVMDWADDARGVAQDWMSTTGIHGVRLVVEQAIMENCPVSSYEEIIEKATGGLKCVEDETESCLSTQSALSVTLIWLFHADIENYAVCIKQSADWNAASDFLGNILRMMDFEDDDNAPAWESIGILMSQKVCATTKDPKVCDLANANVVAGVHIAEWFSGYDFVNEDVKMFAGSMNNLEQTCGLAPLKPKVTTKLVLPLTKKPK